VGILHSRELLQASTEKFDPLKLCRPVPIIHDSLPAMKVIERLKEVPEHMLLVYDEYGDFEGIITPMDILDAITGGFDETEEDEPRFVEREDGTFLVAGWMPVDEFADRVGIELEDQMDFETVAGLVLHHVGALPKVGQQITIGEWRIEVVDMDARRIDKLLVQKLTVPA
jgi:putative hemolysin